MIKTWTHKGLQKLFEYGDTRGIQAKHAKRLVEQLIYLNAATNPEDLRLPGYALHKLQGGYKDYYAITVSGGWRLIFKFDNGDAYSINYLNYH